MPRYELTCWFRTRELAEPAAAVSRWFDLFERVVHTKGQSLKGDEQLVRKLLQSGRSFYSTQLSFRVASGRGKGRGRLFIMKPHDPDATSTLELDFSLKDWRSGLFHSAASVRDCLRIGCASCSALKGSVKSTDQQFEFSDRPDDFSSRADPLVVPKHLEWINVMRVDGLQRVGWSWKALDLSELTDVTSGESEGYGWLQLTSTPFSYQNPEHQRIQKQVEQALGLEELHRRFARSGRRVRPPEVS